MALVQNQRTYRDK